MKTLITLVALFVCLNSHSQEFYLEVEYSTGIKDTVIFGFAENATLGIDPGFNEVNIYGLPLEQYDLRSIQREINSGNDCQYEISHDENIDSKINIRRLNIDDLRSTTFEFILTTQDTNFNIALKGPNLFIDAFISFEPDTCRTSGFPFRFRIEQNLVELDLKPIMRFNGLSTVNYIVLIFKELGVLNNHEQQQTPELSIVPNPASEYIHIANDKVDIQKVSILDLVGNTILEEDGFSNKLIKLKLNPDLEGLYLIKIKLDDNNILVKKLYID